MDIKSLQAEIWEAYKSGQPVDDLTYIKEFADLCRKHPYRESYKEPLNELYKILQKYGDPVGKDDEWWETFVKEIDGPVDKQKGTDAYEYARGYAVIVLNESTRRSKGG